MGNPVPISLGTRSNPSRLSKQAGNARLINCYAEELGDEGKSQWAITAAPGLSDFGLPLSGAIRAMLEVGNFLWVLAGSELYKIDASGNATAIGSIPTTGPAYIRRNRAAATQIAIVSDGYYAYVANDVLTRIQDPDLPTPLGLAYLDGYGVLPIAGGNYMLTSIDDFTAISALDVGATDTNPDEIIAAHELGREMVFFCADSTEWHQDTGNADFPFERSQAATIGWLAPDAIAPFDLPGGETLIGVVADHSIRMLQGYGAVIISTPEIENLIRILHEAGNADDLRATSWSWGGRNFWALSCDDWTRVFDGKNWHERKSHGSERWCVSKVASFGGKLIAGDATTGQLYEMSDDTYDESGNPLVMEIIAPPVHAFPYRAIGNALYIDAASGIGLNTTVTQDLDPVLMVDFSKDGGANFGAARDVALGRLGATAKRLAPVRTLGAFGSKGLTVRLRISAAVQKVVLAAALDFDKLAA